MTQSIKCIQECKMLRLLTYTKILKDPTMIILEEGETGEKGMKLDNILLCNVGIYFNEHECFHNFFCYLAAHFCIPQNIFHLRKLTSIGVQLLYNISLVLFSPVQQNELAIHGHISPLFWIFNCQLSTTEILRTLTLRFGNKKLSIQFIAGVTKR